MTRITHSDVLIDIVRKAKVQISDLKPSEWAERNRVLSSDVSRFPGPFSYQHTPYTREIVDRLSPYDPAIIIVVMKGAQIGLSTGFIESGIGWIISESPGPVLFLTGHAELSESAMQKKIDQMIESCGIRHLIRPNVVKKKNQRTGDTSKGKEFPGGYLMAGTASNHKMLRQTSARYGFFDDYESVKKSSSQSGDTESLLRARFASYRDVKKECYISTPEVKQTSNIEPLFLDGDQRRFHVPCPCCGVPIVLWWTCEMKHPKFKNMKGGVTWEVDLDGKVVPRSVGYICQECGDFFDDSHKAEMLSAGEWVAMGTAKYAGYYSYQISSLYAPPGHDRWSDYVEQYLKANPPGGKRNESKHQAFVNLILGETYEVSSVSPESKSVMRNTRNYKIGTIPEWLSTKDGNGRVIMLTCACDLNGLEKDARLDYEIVAWAENTSSYSVKHGSIGTFIPGENKLRPEDRIDRAHWTYEHKKPNSVWPELEKILRSQFETDTGRKMKILITGIDTGHYTQHAYSFIEKTNSRLVIGIKGDKEGKYRKYGIDQPLYKMSKERTDLYLLDVNHIKDEVAEVMELKWSPGELQPPGFMNYPMPGPDPLNPDQSLYNFNNFFSHYEAEHRVDDYKDNEIAGQKWVKKDSSVQNHAWDLRVYNHILKDIWADKVLAESPKKKGSWADFVAWVLKK